MVQRQRRRFDLSGKDENDIDNPFDLDNHFTKLKEKILMK